jgi:hypothetical protein
MLSIRLLSGISLLLVLFYYLINNVNILTNLNSAKLSTERQLQANSERLNQENLNENSNLPQNIQAKEKAGELELVTEANKKKISDFRAETTNPEQGGIFVK